MTEGLLARAPDSGRRQTLLATLTRLGELAERPVIVEVGTTRNTMPHAMVDDGWATRLFAWYAAEHGGRFVTIDTNRRALERAAGLCIPYTGVVTYRHAEAQDVVGELEAIDLLYMDGPPDPEVNLSIWRALRCRPKLVLWDDIVTPGEAVPGAPPGKKYKPWPPPGDERPYAVKGALAIPAALAAGYRERFAVDRQVLLERED